MHKNVSSVTKCLVKSTTLYFRIDWKDNETDLFHINIYYNSKSWSGRFSNEFAATYMKMLREDENEYRKTVRNVLMGLHQDVPNSSFTFDFSYSPDDRKTAKFSWRKVAENSSVLVEHGSVPMHEDEETESKDVLIDYLLQENEILKKKVQDYEYKNEILSNDLNECRKKLGKFMEQKMALETTLYGKFGQLLNSKKRRIKLLEQRLHLLEKNSNENELD